MAAIVEGVGLTKRFGTGDATVVAVDAVDIRIGRERTGDDYGG